MRATVDTRKVLFRIELQKAYRLLCLLRSSNTKDILDILSQHPPFHIYNAQLVELVALADGHDSLFRQSNVSQRISLLKKKNLILAERKGKYIYYAINVDRVAEINSAITTFLYPVSDGH